MNLRIEYQPSAKELTKASSLFVEKKPFFSFCVGFINVFSGLFLIIFAIKLLKIGLNLHEGLAAIVCILWLFCRRPFNEWLLFQRMKSSKVIEKPITIDISFNGIVWSGKGLRPGNMSWDQVKYILEAKNGFVIPNTFTKFLWFPFRGFNSPQDIEALRSIITEKKIVLRVFPKWQC